MTTLHQSFAQLHVPGDPLILFNAWDPGSAAAVARAGARAIATGSFSVAAAHGFADGEALPLELALANATRIVKAVELPVTIDFEGGYAADPEGCAAHHAQLAATGAVGCNFEDRVIGGEGLHETAAQAARIAAVRKAVGAGFFINARTDIFLQSKPDTHDEAKAAAAIARAITYAEAGASGFFIPGLRELALIQRICRESPLPVNVLAFPGAPSTVDFARAGVARISHGPHPYRLMLKALEDAARTAYLR
jgi:2-methylisocitrate lyase-like PEP mutase family enzyme